MIVDDQCSNVKFHVCVFGVFLRVISISNLLPYSLCIIHAVHHLHTIFCGSLSLPGPHYTSLIMFLHKHSRPSLFGTLRLARGTEWKRDKSSSRVEGGGVLSGQEWGEEGEVRESVSS